MLESVGPLGYVIRKLNQVRENLSPSQSRFEASRLRVTAEGLVTLAGQERIYDSDTFNSWVAAKLDGKEKAAEFFERRFSDEYRPAFTAWLGTDPFSNAKAPPGPMFMPDYHNAKHEQFLGLSKQAADVADEGTKSGENGDEYVRITVLLATVLLITAIGQRFHGSCLSVALPALVASAYAAPHLTGTVSVAYLISAKGAISC